MLRQRDLGIFIICAVSLFFSFQHQSADFHIDLEFSEALPDQKELDPFPKPIITDLESDGLAEIITATTRPRPLLQILHLEHGKRLAPLSENMKTARRQAVAVGTGYLDKFTAEHSRKQVIVVVLHDWSVLCFDHNLKLLWETRLVSEVLDEPPRDVSILITPQDVHKGDRGMVVIASLIDYENVEKLRATQREQEGLDGDVQGQGAAQGQSMIHYSYFAFDGRTGEQRWAHESGDFMVSSHLEETTTPQHNYKMDLHSNTQHTGEVDWREFRFDLLNFALPHAYRHSKDTQLKISHFSKNNKNKLLIPGENKKSGDATDALLAAGSGMQVPGAAQRPHADGDHVSKPNVLISHSLHGVEILHLFTGRTLCQLTPLSPDSVYVDLNGDGIIEKVYAQVDKKTSGPLRRTALGIVESGAPTKNELLWNVTLNAPSDSASSFPFGDLFFGGRRTGGATDVSRLVPSVPAVMTSYKSATPKKNVIFLTSNGEVTCTGPDGKVIWQTSTSATWDPYRDLLENVDDSLFVSSVEVFKPREGYPQELILVHGSKHLVLLNGEDGKVQDEADLLGIPAGPLTFGDFNNDGVLDVMITTKRGYVGYSVKTKQSTSILTAIMGLLLFVFGLLFVSQHLLTTATNEPTRRQPAAKRSTD